MGKTAYWDEFRCPETGKAEGHINFGSSWHNDVMEQWKKALDAVSGFHLTPNSIYLAKMLQLGGALDFKSQGGGQFDGALFNGCYSSRRSIGNFLAGQYSHWILGTSFDEFMRLVGAVEALESSKGVPKYLGLGLASLGKEYGKPPYYGEDEYSGRMSAVGWLFDSYYCSNKNRR